MPFRLSRAAVAVVLAASVGLVALPACKKKPKPPPEAETPGAEQAPQPRPAPGPQPGGNSEFGAAPRSPVFGTSDPRTAALRAQAEGNMKTILIAMHGFHDSNNSFPAGFADKTGKPGLSWRVAILPYIEQDALFKQFKLDEPWDSEHNKKLIPKMPKLFAPPNTDANGYTFIRGFTGPGTWLPSESQKGQPGQALRGVGVFNFSDGTSNTILVAEAYEPVIWTKPDEVQVAPGQAPKLGGVFASGFVAGMADGRVKFVRSSVSPKELTSAVLINDGQPGNLDE